MRALNPYLPAFKTKPGGCGGKTISDDQAEDEAQALRAQLAGERAARAAAERELAELQVHRRHLESRAINARQTLAYGLGRALIEARRPKGLIGLPGRLRTLWLRQKAKRKERVPDTVPSDIANHMQLADQALEKARSDGLGSTLDWLENRSDGAARARAFAELALNSVAEDVEQAGAIGLRAARLAPEESRLLAVMAALEAAGAISAPAQIGREISAAQLLSEPQKVWIARLNRACAMLQADTDGAIAPATRQGATGQVETVLLIAPERWRSSPRAAAAGRAAEAAGIDLEFGFSHDRSENALAHILPDSLDYAESAMGRARELALPVLLDLANRPPAIAADSSSEAGRAEALRLEKLAGAANRLIARGPAMAGWLAERGLEANLVEDDWSLAGKPDAAEIESARTEFGIAPGERVIAALTCLREDTGLRGLLSAFGDVVQSNHADRLAVIGRGPGAPWLARQASMAGIEDRLLFFGMPHFERWPALFSAFEAVVFPSDREEALGSELPMAMPLAAALGIPLLLGDQAWASRTTDAIPRTVAGEDWAAALRELPGALQDAAKPPPDDLLRRLYSRLRDG